jgi:hypothetical protein
MTIIVQKTGFKHETRHVRGRRKRPSLKYAVMVDREVAEFGRAGWVDRLSEVDEGGLGTAFGEIGTTVRGGVGLRLAF